MTELKAAAHSTLWQCQGQTVGRGPAHFHRAEDQLIFTEQNSRW